MNEGYFRGYLSLFRRNDLGIYAKLVFCLIHNYCRMGTAYPGMNRLGKDLHVSTGTIKRAINELRDSEMIVVRSRGRGRSNIYIPLQSEIGELLVQPDQECNNQCQSNPGSKVAGTLVVGSERSPKRKETLKETPLPPKQIKTFHFKEKPFDAANKNPKNLKAIPRTYWTKKQVQEIYMAYPRQVEPRPAHRAIRKALCALANGTTTSPDLEPIGKEAFPALLDRTRQYAKTVENVPPEKRKLIPYPASWFNSENFNSNSNEWEII